MAWHRPSLENEPMIRSSLRLEPAADPDAIYQVLVDAHDALSPEQGRIMETRLILLLANHIGDPAAIAQAVALARAGLAVPEPG
jgi:Protein of unknown function (DUF2783)